MYVRTSRPKNVRVPNGQAFVIQFVGKVCRGIEHYKHYISNELKNDYCLTETVVEAMVCPDEMNGITRRTNTIRNYGRG